MTCECDVCGGVGKVETPSGFFRVTCPRCDGLGTVFPIESESTGDPE